MSFKPVTHVIFDMDGLLLNTEDIYTEAYQNICSEFNQIYDWDTKVSIMGKKFEVAAKVVIDKLKLPITIEEFREKLDKQLDELFTKSKLLPGAERLVQHLAKHHIPMALCTGSTTAAYHAKTSHHSTLFSVFNPKVLCSDDEEVKFGKPHPDAYEITCKRFQPKAPSTESCLVFEDSPNGVLSAIDANMQCVMVPDKRMNKEGRKNATLVLESLEDFKPELFGLPPFEQ